MTDKTIKPSACLEVSRNGRLCAGAEWLHQEIERLTTESRERLVSLTKAIEENTKLSVEIKRLGVLLEDRDVAEFNAFLAGYNTVNSDADSDLDKSWEKYRDSGSQQFVLGIDLAKPGSDTTGFICSYCKAIMFSAEEADQHTCADSRREPFKAEPGGRKRGCFEPRPRSEDLTAADQSQEPK